MMSEGSLELPVTASAPGKVVLCGEYAVLEGAPAICMAVNRRARVSLSVSPCEDHLVSAPGFAAATGRFRAAADEFEWLEYGAEFALVESLWQTARPKTSVPLSLKLDSREQFEDDGGRKTGIGSSAALTVALANALCAVAETDAPPTALAFAAHRHLQGGLGSGVDIACSTSGGLVEYAMGSGPGKVLDWPAGLVVGFVGVGRGVSTRDKLELLRRQVPRPSRAALVLAARRLADAWSRGDVDSLLEEYRDYTSVLQEFSADHELGVFDAGHEELARVAATLGVVYKPCGAGGGDTGAVFGSDPAVIGAFLTKAGNMGMYHLDLRLEPDGVVVEGSER